MAKQGRAEFVKWMNPVLVALRDLGGSGKPREVTEKIVVTNKISQEQLDEKLKSGMSRFQNQVYWARQYLVWEGLLESTKKGVWKLSEKGAASNLSDEQSHKLFLKWVGIHAEKRKAKEAQDDKADEPEIDEIDIDDTNAIKTDYRQELLKILRAMPPMNFEKFSLLLLRENDFEDLRLTGGSKDEGIDGSGILRINPVVSFRVLFQCKRYKEDNKVIRTQIADFRNSMLGRAEKGIFITTSYFTRDAEMEANRDGASPIELVDADKLVAMIENSELGLKEVKTYEIDREFFKQYQD